MNPAVNLPWSPLIAVPPRDPDFSICHPVYGTGISSSDCIQAAGRLPSGMLPISHANTFPILIHWGNCEIQVTWSNPDVHEDHLVAVPDLFRNLAAFLINSCVVSEGGIGGFGTVGLQNLFGVLLDPNVDLADFPPGASFYTVTVTGWPDSHSTIFTPGDDDPAMSEAVADALWNARNNLPRHDDLFGHYTELATDVAERSRLMRRGGTGVPWWPPWWAGKITPQRPKDQMTYECDAKLGAPAAVDCSRLEFSELGPDSDSMRIAPGVSKFLSSNTCNVIISASISVVLTWAQIKAALETLVNICVMHPLVPARGGRAHQGTETITQSVFSRDRPRKRDAVSGLNALPPGCNISVFQDVPSIPADLREDLMTYLSKAGGH